MNQDANIETDDSGEFASGILPSDVILKRDGAEEASRVVREAVRRAPFPSLSGLAFEIMGLAWVFGALTGFALIASLIAGDPTVSGAVGRILPVPTLQQIGTVLAVAAPIILLCVRIASGYADIASDGVGQGSGANIIRAWKLGRRTQVSALGIWVQVFGMMLMATLVLLGPLVVLRQVVGSEALGPIGVVLSGLALAFALVYGTALGALQELAMASLVRHERGVGSAILHAWRLIRNRRATSGRMALVEMTSRLAIVLVAGTLARYVGPAWGCAQLVLFGALVGGLRCHAWSLAYPRVGGLAATSRSPE